jgi:hypothetical protein
MTLPRRSPIECNHLCARKKVSGIPYRAAGTTILSDLPSRLVFGAIPGQTSSTSRTGTEFRIDDQFGIVQGFKNSYIGGGLTSNPDSYTPNQTSTVDKRFR